MKLHIQLEKSTDYTKVIVCGSPERAEWFASLLEGARPIAKNREYHSFLGESSGQKILITSHGVGSAGAAICFNELIKVGAQKIVRIGTAGGLYRGTRPGDVVVPNAAVRKDGVSSLMIPAEYPAIADPKLTAAIAAELTKTKTEFRSGIILTSDLFYPGKLDDQLKLYSEAGVVAVEMECATLFVIASLAGVSSSAIVVLDGSPLEWDSGNYDPSPERLKASLESGFRAAVAALTTK